MMQRQEIENLRKALRAVAGVQVQMGGIDTLDAIRILVEAVVDLCDRVEKLEKRTPP